MPRRLLLAGLVAGALAVPPAALAHLDHPAPTVSGPSTPLSTDVNAGGEGAKWDLLATVPTANPHSDLDFFTNKGETYASVGSLGTSANGGGQIIVQLTEGGEVEGAKPKVVGNVPSATCVSNPTAALGLQHDVEATPKGPTTLLNTDVRKAPLGDAQLLLDASDAAGRCHDQGIAGLAGAPRGGLEIIDVKDPSAPKEIHLTSHIGEAHTVNVDPRRPHIAYAITSDRVGVNAEGVRDNEGTGRGLDGFEVINLRTCLEAPLGTLPVGTSIEDKRKLCRPQVWRYRYPSVNVALGHTNQNAVYGCHELEVYPDDRLTCGAGAAMIMFDLSEAFDDAGTPSDPTDDVPRGTPLPCDVRDSSTQLAAFKTGAKVTDCVNGKDAEGKTVDLGVRSWKAMGSPSLEGVRHLGSAFHMGRESATGAAQPKYNAKEDVDFDHEAELTASGRFVIASDERGGGVTVGSQCTQASDLDFANGGLHAYAVDRLQPSTPEGSDAQVRAAQAHEAYARTSSGDKAIFRAPPRTPLAGSFCTAHVFQQIPGQNRIFMGWYSQGTQVVDFVEGEDGSLTFKQAGWFVPEGANTWVSSIFRTERNDDGTWTYYGATGDGIVGDAGRNAVDVFKVTLPAPPEPLKRATPQNDAGAAGVSTRKPKK